MRNRRTLLLSITTGVAVAGVLAGTAQASAPSVVAVIKQQDRIVRQVPGWKILQKDLDAKTASAARLVVPVIGPIVKASAHEVAVVGKASTSSTQQQQGKSEWLKGDREVNHALLHYRTALRDLIAGKTAAFKSADVEAQNLLARGVTASYKGDRLLHISVND